MANCKVIMIDSGIEKIINVYGEGVDGLTPILTSPINSVDSSPSSTFSRSEELNTKCQDLISLLDSTQEGKLLLTQHPNPLGDQLRRSLTREIATEIVKLDPKAPITSNIYLHWIREIKRVFPAENTSIYYTKGPQVFGRAHGRLFDAVTNLKAKYRRNKIYQPRARRSIEKTFTPTTASVEHATTNKRTAPVREGPETTSDSQADLDSENTEIEECFEWLRSTADNYTLCNEKWAPIKSKFCMKNSVGSLS
ncbi:uncharacterized protein LOC125241434 [Leguminivora glycinivorella]|uniref:uncharacterized protein LOC125241434 n=1 Tax=Leguminivora glycinivorella TaxID=1035111 RepID=UPI00200E2FF8|nr:uncharacterized protein LOC125241434 [Leguminivora glycinivorella]